jgi:hypothetical protein
VFAQDYGNNAETLKLCTTLQTNSFSSNLDADSALDRILDVVGLSKNFVLAPCSDINNAVAVSFKGVRYILYDPDFMSMLSSNTSNWTNLFILAHEVGHHVNGHSLDLVLYAGEIIDAPELKKKREQELEADEFAGFVLAKLGASLNQSTLSVVSLSNKDDKYSTHPKRSKRELAIKKGYYRGSDKSNTTIETRISKKDEVSNPTSLEQRKSLAREYFLKGREQFNSGNINLAIKSFEYVAYSIPKPNGSSTNALYYLALCHRKLGDNNKFCQLMRSIMHMDTAAANWVRNNCN